MNTNKKAGFFNNHGHNNNTKIAKSSCYIKSDAVKQLENLANKSAQEKYPMIPSEWLAPRKYRDDSTNALTKCVIDFIRFTGNQAERISNTGKLKIEKKVFTDVVGYNRNIINTHWIPRTGSNGTVDISATIQGKSVKIKIKFGTNRQIENQKQYQQNIERAGGIYFIANSFEHFLNWYKENFDSDVKPSTFIEP